MAALPAYGRSSTRLSTTMPPPAASPMPPATSRADTRPDLPRHVPTCRHTSAADSAAVRSSWGARCGVARALPGGGLGRLNAWRRLGAAQRLDAPPSFGAPWPFSLGASASYLAIPCSSTLYPCSSTLSEAPTALCCSCWCPLPSSLQPHSPPQRRRVLCVACVSIAPLRKGASHGSTLQNIFRCPT
jgi:hypothetical protein